MRHFCGSFCLALSSILPTTSIGQTQTSAFLDHAQTASVGDKSVATLKFNGTAEWFSGSLHETGTVQAEAHADGSSRFQLTLATASRSETRSKLDPSRTCSWTDASGTSHTITASSCFAAIPWFAPTLFTQPTSRLPALMSLTDVGEVIKDGATFHQISYSANVAESDQASRKTFVDQSTVRVFYDPLTYLPARIEYVVRSTNNSGANLDVKVLFGNYQSVSGVMIPFHVERYLQRTLQLKLDVSNASIE